MLLGTIFLFYGFWKKEKIYIEKFVEWFYIPRRKLSTYLLSHLRSGRIEFCSGSEKLTKLFAMLKTLDHHQCPLA